MIHQSLRPRSTRILLHHRLPCTDELRPHKSLARKLNFEDSILKPLKIITRSIFATSLVKSSLQYRDL